jgi:hypothetical protein
VLWVTRAALSSRGVTATQPSREVPAHYRADIPTFLATSDDEVLGALLRGAGGNVDATQRNAWIEEIGILKVSLSGLAGSVFLEFAVPRVGSRIDAVVIVDAAVLPIEFKCGESSFSTSAFNQAWDYGLDLKNFHEASHAASIFPVVVATAASQGDSGWSQRASDDVWAPHRATTGSLLRVIREAVSLAAGPLIESSVWGVARYRPTPTIVEAARSLYSRHTVDDITRNDAGSMNLTVTAAAVEEIAEHARVHGDKAIVFVTGVPGAGKTLVGLDIATRRRAKGDDHAVYLSGNDPLLAVLHEALTRDELARRPGTRKGDVRQKVKAFIQNIHHFRDEGLRDVHVPPVDRVVIFDEAQRAWNQRKATTWMKLRKGVADFNQSESAFLISYLQRHHGWAVIVCLVGGGQEIHDGEAGIGAWLEAVRAVCPHWRAFVSPHLSDSEYAVGDALQQVNEFIVTDSRLHLATSMRSFRSERVSSLVKAILDGDADGARSTLGALLDRYPLAVTRSLDRAREWVRARARGSERFGLVASSQAQRLKPLAIDVRVNVNPIHWFLGDSSDVRSSNYLEDAATEFQVQGLELDWACVTWDADLRLSQGRWSHHSFHGSRWKNVNAPDRQMFLVNAYRVLLTRARQGMVIFVPEGDWGDATRKPEFYDGTFDYLTRLGIPTI